MLYIQCKGEIPKDCIVGVVSYFDGHKEKDWFNRQDVKEVIKGVDNTIAVKDEYLESPVFGGMSPDRLSGGCKALILMLVTDKMIYATKCGDNCAKYIIEISKTKDLHICLHNCMRFMRDFDAIFEDTGEEIHTFKEFVEGYYRIRHNRDY
jgi:hypothetical protein